MSIQSRISEILALEAAAIAAVRVTPAFEQAVLTLRDSTGKVLTTGMGKAGHVARKFASTLCSTGTPAYYVHPGEAAHGDLGIVEPDDCVVAFSTSGKTQEVIDMLGKGRALGIGTIISITSHPESELRDLSDLVVDMGVITEPCSHGLTPSASIAVMLAISDALALVLMDLKQFSRTEFGRRHHGGYLGAQSRTEPDE
jgi:arabinose-5-phosphate isomerase